jgi:hypothetical protein
VKRPSNLLVRQPQQRRNMTKQDILNAIQFLERTYVGLGEQERLFKTIESLKQELIRRAKK